MGKRLAVFLNIFLLLQSLTFSSLFEHFSFTSKFFGLKLQQSIFLKKKNSFESSFYKIDV